MHRELKLERRESPELWLLTWLTASAPGGKLSPPSKWQKDEDGTPVPTIRARKIYL